MNTKQKIIEIATRLVQERGVHGWSYDSISKEIGIKKASIHYYFPEKNDLLLDLLKTYITTFFSHLDRIQSSLLSSREKLLQMIDIYRKVYHAPQEICLCTSFSTDSLFLSEHISSTLCDFYKKLEEWIQITLQAGIEKGDIQKHLNATHFSCLLINTLQGLLVMSKIKKREGDFEACIELIVSLM